MFSLFFCAPGRADSVLSEITYGSSENGRPLVCFRVGQSDASHALLLIFGVHGFEDAYDRDGEVLRLIAHRVIDAFAASVHTLGDYALYVVPCANPDGLIDGKSSNGYGRCNARGIDVNRDFPVNWSEQYRSRIQTGSEPFSTAEARAIRDLVTALSPACAVDVHGWLSSVYGEGPFSSLLAEAFGLNIRAVRSGGTLVQWLKTAAEEAVLLELPHQPNSSAYVDVNSEKLIASIRSYCAQPRTSE